MVMPPAQTYSVVKAKINVLSSSANILLVISQISVLWSRLMGRGNGSCFKEISMYISRGETRNGVLYKPASRRSKQSILQPPNSSSFSSTVFIMSLLPPSEAEEYST
jgi:hypothetical protein